MLRRHPLHRQIYKGKIKLTFARAPLDDPTRLFNASLDGTRRAIDVREGGAVDETAFKALIAKRRRQRRQGRR
jgi:hypothetical protein